MIFPPHHPTLSTTRLHLRPLTAEDADDLRPVVALYPGSARRPVEQVLASVYRAFETAQGLTWGLEHHGQVIGTIGFYRGFDRNLAEVGYVMRPGWRGQGLMSEALEAVLNYSSEAMQLRGVRAYTRDENTASRRLLSKWGFTETALIQEGYRCWSRIPEPERGVALTTARLRLRFWTKEDHSRVMEMNGNPQVMRHFPEVETPEQSADWLDRARSGQVLDGFTYFCAELKENGAFVGCLGLAEQRKQYPYHPCVDLGWRLLPEYWGKRLATEGAKACLDFAWDTLGLKRVRAFCPVVNTSSEGVMLRLGMEKLGTFQHPALVDHPRISRVVAYEMIRPA